MKIRTAGPSQSSPTRSKATATDDQTDLFNLPSLTLFQPTDQIHIAIGDNGSFLFDHVNVNAWITIPAPGATALLAGLGLLTRRRR